MTLSLPRIQLLEILPGMLRYPENKLNSIPENEIFQELVPVFLAKRFRELTGYPGNYHRSEGIKISLIAGFFFFSKLGNIVFNRFSISVFWDLNFRKILVLGINVFWVFPVFYGFYGEFPRMKKKLKTQTGIAQIFNPGKAFVFKNGKLYSRD